LHYLATLPKALPALVARQKAQSKAARVNFDWTALRDVIAKVEEEFRETKEAIQSERQEMIERRDWRSAVRGRKPGAEMQNRRRKRAPICHGQIRRALNRLEDELKALGRKLGEAELAEMDAIWDEIKSKSDQAGVIPVCR
jgi:ATP diphosphatase